MNLYRTARGAWVGTQAAARSATKAEGSPRGSWREVYVPTDKPGLLAYLNHRGETVELARPAAGAPPPAQSKPLPRGGTRWRVRYRGMFVGVTVADTEALALSNIAAELTARPSP